MMWKYKLMLVGWLCLFGAIKSQAQWGPYHFQRKLDQVEMGWQQLSLPDDMYRQLRPDLHDLRIKGITGAGDTLEAPYLIHWPNPVPKFQSNKFEIINQSRRGGTFYATLSTGDRHPINRISLDIDHQNFDWRVELEGSQDQRRWFTVLDDYRILDVHDPQREYRFSTLHFPSSNFPYYRIAVKTQEAIKLNEAQFYNTRSPGIEYRYYPITQQKIEENREEKRTELELELPTPVPVSQVQLTVLDTFDYYRPLRIELLTDSTRTESGWNYHFTQIYAGTLSSLEASLFAFTTQRSRRIRIFIYNQDNRPLRIGQVQIAGAPPKITVRFTEPADYHLLYGWPEARQPSYDITRFADKIPTDLSTLALGPETHLQPELEVRNPLVTNRAWLWAIMIVIIGLLAWFSLKMLKNT